MAKKNIMLVFLSDAKFHGNWQPSLANYAGGITETKTTSESAIRYILNSGIKLDYLFAFETAMIKGDIYREKNDAKIYYHDQFGNRMTHVEYFRQTMKEYLPEIMSDAFYQSSDFNVGLNDNDGSDTMQAVVNMAEKIQSCVDLEQDDVTLHVDCTGGFRSANIAILAVVRLLEYAGVKIGKLVYSNYVRDGVGTVIEIRELYNLFNLIAGAEEFTNFGSVKALDKYFKSIPETYILNSEINNLLKSMRNFSRAIRLCMPKRVEKNAVKLMEAIIIFKKCTFHGRYEKVFSQLITHIENEYGEFSNGDRSEVTLNIIKWCIRQELWQQAITFSYERLPIYICDKKILYPVDEDVQKYSDEIHHEWQQCFIIKHQVGKLNNKGIKLHDFMDDVKPDNSGDYIGLWGRFVKDKDKFIKAYLDEQNMENLLWSNLIKDISMSDEIIKEISKNKVIADKILKEHEELYKLLRFLYYIDKGTSSDFIEFICKLRKKTILEKMFLNNSDTFIIKDDIFNLIKILQNYRSSCGSKKRKEIRDGSSKEPMWDSVERFWRCCLDQGRVKSIENDQDKIIAVLKAYSDLRTMRNKLNHANASDELSEKLEKEVIDVLNKCISSIEYITAR